MQSVLSRPAATESKNADSATDGAAANGQRIHEPTPPVSLKNINPKVRSYVSFEHISLQSFNFSPPKTLVQFCKIQ